ncbi:MAG: ABC transporter transmembrane domain-containing protein, partial [Planctomycetia bacterium]
MISLLSSRHTARKDAPIATATANPAIPQQDTPPPSGSPPARTCLEIDTDVSLDGRPTPEWLVATADELRVTAGGQALRRVSRDEVEEVRTTAGVGGGTLQVRVDGDWVDLLRYSNAMATRFHKVARALEQPGSEAEFLAMADDLDPPRCPSCRLRLTTKDQACPRCMQKGRILKRVGELLAPYTRGAVILCLLTFVGVVAELVPPKLQQYMVDSILTRGSTAADAAAEPDFKTALLVVVLALALSRVLLSAVGMIKGRLATAIGTGLTGTLRSEMVSKLQNLSVAYYDRHQVGSMISRVAHDSEVLHGL